MDMNEVLYAERARPFLASVSEGLAREEAAQHRLKGRERHGVVARIEGILIPLLAEVCRALEHRMASIPLARIAVHAEVMVVVIALENPVMLDQPMVVFRYVGPEDCSA